jgi:hypothetical protein
VFVVPSLSFTGSVWVWYRLTPALMTRFLNWNVINEKWFVSLPSEFCMRPTALIRTDVGCNWHSVDLAATVCVYFVNTWRLFQNDDKNRVQDSVRAVSSVVTLSEENTSTRVAYVVKKPPCTPSCCVLNSDIQPSVRVPPDVISLQLFTSKVVGV